MTSSDAETVPKLATCCTLVLLSLPGIVLLALQPLEILLGPGERGDVARKLPEYQIRLSLMANWTILVALSALVGAVLAPRVHFHAPVIEALLRGRSLVACLQRQLLPAVILGALVSCVLAVFEWYQAQTLPELVQQLKASGETSLLAGALYGGVVEEILCRWGAMSLFVWCWWKLLQNGTGMPSPQVVWTGNLFAALLFGAGHLPVAFVYGMNTPFWVCVIIAGNAVPGMGFGWLFWRRGLEASMMAHALAHAFAAPMSNFIATMQSDASF